jgi:hypothetical protein
MKFEVDIPVETEKDRAELKKFHDYLSLAPFSVASFLTKPFCDALRTFMASLPPLDSDVTVTLKRSEWAVVTEPYYEPKKASPLNKIRDQVNRA